MPLDAIYLSHVAQELRNCLTGARVDKIHQPSRDTVVLALRGQSGTFRLLLCANSSHPRAHITAVSLENPASPPMFCMLLRKHLTGGRLHDILQPPMERVLDFTFQCTNEFGEDVKRHLVIELMGRNSNLILCGEDGHIIDCVRRVDYDMSQQRQVLPGLFYHLPPRQDKVSPFDITLADLSGMLEKISSPVRPDSFLLDHFAGLSPLICRELVSRYDPELEDLNALPLSGRYTFAAYLIQEFSRIQSDAGTPYLLMKGDEAWDYTYAPIVQYGTLVQSCAQESFSSLLDRFYARKDAAARMKSRSSGITKTVTNLRNRAARKLANQRKELAATADRDALRIKGELVTANLYRIERGQTRLVVENYYDPELKSIEIPLDPTRSPQQNAAKFFKDYNKAKNAEIYLTEEIRKGTAEIDYLDSILDEISRAETEKDLIEIRQELVSGGYVREQDRRKRVKTPPSRPMEFTSSSGLRIRVGRNNSQNDQLTLKSSFKSDLWFHAQKIHGSHVILSCEGGDADEASVMDAARLAAYYSQSRNGQNVPVDYTMVKNVKKPTGAKPGMVIYDHYNTVYVTPEQGVLPRLLK